MILLPLIAFPVLELYVLFKVGGQIGLINTIFALLAAAVLGSGLAKSQGRYINASLQQSLLAGQMPGKEVVHRLLVFVAGVLFLIPGFISDVVAFFLLLPGTRHLMVALIRRKLEAKLQTGQFKVFTSAGGFGATGGFRAGGPFRRPGASRDGDQDFGRDITPKVIDVTPISTSSRQSEADESGDEGSEPRGH